MEVKDLKEKLCVGLETKEDDSPFRKVEKVLAPFMRTLKKRKQEKADVISADFEELYLKRSPKDILGHLQSIITDPLSQTSLLNETAELLKVVTKSKSVNLYLVDNEANELLLCPKYVPRNPRYERRYNIESGTYLAAHVAFTKEYVISSDILGDVRFPQGIPEVSTVKSVLCIPIVTNIEGNCIGVVELYRDCSERPYDLVNLQICTALTAWMGIAIEENKKKIKLNLQVEIQDQICLIASIYFSGLAPFTKVLSDILRIAKIAGSAEKGAFFLFHEPVTPDINEPIFADAFEEVDALHFDSSLYKKANKVRFVKNQPGIAGYVARSGEIINIRDAYKDSRFDKKTDSIFVRTRSVAGFPIKNENGVIGVLLLMNNLSYPYFRQQDIQIIESFLNTISLICSYFLIDNFYFKTQLRLIVKDRLLDYYMKPSNEEFTALKNSLQQELPVSDDFFSFDYDLSIHEDEAHKYIAILFLSMDFLVTYFDSTKLLDFVLRVKKSYRPVIFHNFEHAFSVFHCTLCIILKARDLGQAAFRPLEVLAMLLAALCHDIDHTGFTNNFISLKNDVIYKLYGDFCGEAHRYNLTLFIIQQSNLLANLPAEMHDLILKNLKRLMVGFDLALHFQHKKEIIELINENRFDLGHAEHRILAQHIALIVSDFSYNYKSFEYVKKETFLFYKELYHQGDMEKMMGFTPMGMLDRNKIDIIPENQKILLTVVLLPCIKILGTLYPPMTVLNTYLQNTLDKWNEIIALRGLEMWNLNSALILEKKDRRSRRVTVTSTLSSLKTVSSQSKSLLG